MTDLPCNKLCKTTLAVKLNDCYHFLIINSSHNDSVKLSTRAGVQSPRLDFFHN